MNALPCPFCGANPREGTSLAGGVRFYCRECPNADQEPFDTRDQAVKAWNQRSTSAESARVATIEAENERLRDALADIANPLPAIERHADENGLRLSGEGIVALFAQPSYYREKAAKALEAK